MQETCLINRVDADSLDRNCDPYRGPFPIFINDDGLPVAHTNLDARFQSIQSVRLVGSPTLEGNPLIIELTLNLAEQQLSFDPLRESVLIHIDLEGDVLCGLSDDPDPQAHEETC